MHQARVDRPQRGHEPGLAGVHLERPLQDPFARLLNGVAQGRMVGHDPSGCARLRAVHNSFEEVDDQTDAFWTDLRHQMH